MIRIDERTGNLFILAGGDESIELEIDPEGELLPWVLTLTKWLTKN